MDNLYCHDVDQQEHQHHQQQQQPHERRHHESGDQEPLSPRSSVGSVKPDSTASSAPSSHPDYLMPPPSHHQSSHHQLHQPQLHVVQHHLPSFSEMEAAARKRSEEAESDEHILSQSPSQRPALGLNLMTYPQQQTYPGHQQQTQFIVTQDSRGRFSSGGSSDSSSSVRMATEEPLRSLAVLQSGYEHEGIHVERPPSELSINSSAGHFLSMTPDTPTSLEYHPNHHHAGPPPTPLPRHHPQQESPHQHPTHHQPQPGGPVGHPPPLPPTPEMIHHGKPSYSSQLHHNSNNAQEHHHQHNQGPPPDSKRAKREQARNYVKQKRMEIQQNDPEKYEQLKEKNRLRRREKLKEIRDDPVRYEEMKRKQRERVKEQRERIKQNPEAYEEMKRKQREREKARRREIMSDPATAAAWRERHRVMARERRLKRKIMYHLSDMSRQSDVSPDIKLEPPMHGHEHDHDHDDHEREHDIHVHLHERDMGRERDLDREHEQMHAHHRHPGQHYAHLGEHAAPLVPPRLHNEEEERYISVEHNDIQHHQHHHPHGHHPEPEHLVSHQSHHLEPIPSAETPLPPPPPPPSTSGITPQQALTALIQSSEPIQEQINKYFAELKRSSEKRTDLILQLGLRKRQDSNKKRRSGARGKRQSSSPSGTSGFSPSCLDENGVLFKTAAGENIGLKMEDDWGPIGSNDDSQASSDDFNTSGGSVTAGVVMVEHGGYALHSGPSAGTNPDMLFGGISPPPSPGMAPMGPPSDLSLNNLGPRSGHHLHHSGGITLVDEHGAHLHPHQVLPPQPAHHHHQQQQQHHHVPHAHHPPPSAPPHPHGHHQHLYAPPPPPPPPPPSTVGGGMQEDLCQIPEDHSTMLHHVNPPQDHQEPHPGEHFVHHHPRQLHHGHGHSQQHLHHVHHMGTPGGGIKGEGPQMSPCRQVVLDPQMDQRRGFASSVSPETVIMDCSQQRLNSFDIYDSYRTTDSVAPDAADDTRMPTGSYIIARREIESQKLEPGVKEEFSESSSTAGASPRRHDSPLTSIMPPASSAPVAVDMSYLPKMGP